MTLSTAWMAAAVLTGTLAAPFASGSPSPASAAGPPGAPANLTVTADGSSQVTLSWNPPADGVPILFYRVEDGTDPPTIINAPTTSDTLTVTTGTTYTFQVTATDANKLTGPPATQTYTALNPQTITFGQLPGQPVGAQFTVGAAATSGLPVTFASATPAVCTVSGQTVTAVAAGTCTVTADQSGDADYAPAAEVTRSFQVAPVGSAGGLPLPVIRAAGAALAVLAATAATVLAIRRRTRSRRRALQPHVEVTAHAGPPPVVGVHANRTAAMPTVRIEAHAGAGSTIIEEFKR